MNGKIFAHTPAADVSQYLVYKDYYGTMRIDIEQDMLFGHVVGLSDKISYQGKTVKELERDFRESIDDYISLCKEVGKTPEKSFSGKILLRSTPERHGKIALLARQSGKSINAWLIDLVDAALRGDHRAL